MTAGPPHSGTAEDAPGPAGRRHSILLQAEPARHRQPAATVWHLRTYDDATRTATDDLGHMWRPEPPRLDGTVPPPVVEWAATILGPGLAISDPADYAGPHAWHVHATDPPPA